MEITMSGYLGVLIFALFIVAFAVVSLGAAWLLRPSRPDAIKLMNYECGAEPVGPAWVQFPAGFYLVAIVFIVFDALAVFLFPWAMVLHGAGLGTFAVMAAFIAIILLGWLYAYREGVLEWK
jgi:NADH-quinone oxidoreductase subunit A